VLSGFFVELKMETPYGLIAGGDAAAPGVPAKTYC